MILPQLSFVKASPKAKEERKILKLSQIDLIKDLIKKDTEFRKSTVKPVWTGKPSASILRWMIFYFSKGKRLNGNANGEERNGKEREKIQLPVDTGTYVS